MNRDLHERSVRRLGWCIVGLLAAVSVALFGLLVRLYSGVPQ